MVALDHHWNDIVADEPLELYDDLCRYEHRRALLADGGRVGQYDQVTSFWRIGGTWKPLPGAEPFDGEIGNLMRGSETRVESECELSAAPVVLKALRAAHPYEEPIIRFIPLHEPRVDDPSASTGPRGVPAVKAVVGLMGGSAC